ncbi:hypothetical protein R0135_13970 [Congregibacter variabilis]|uniref:Uncharacterized protein n=1 Tax=Congregibacter variabilis TaxID=3081200 RepID=A0ABZ0I2N8_9GAMM|nr:hypothetical protein R0135_13970 [Congregibacter sp. IMCC43200]
MNVFLSLVVLIAGLSSATVSVADTTLYHIVSQKELDTLTQDNVYSPLSIELEGYIHFSKLELIMDYANGPYLDREVLFLLQVTFSDDDEYLRWIGDNPDYYRGLDLSMVERKGEFTRDKNGLWVLPEIFQ